MRRTRLERTMRLLGWHLVGPTPNGRYDIWANADGRELLIQRVDIINRYTARRIAQDAAR